MSDVAQLLVDHLDVWTGAVERKNGAGRGNCGKLSLYGIEKLRALILDLAVHGKLVPQDRMDEPASALQTRLRAQAKSPAAKSFVSKHFDEPNPSPDDTPFPAPQGWQWVRVAHLGHAWGQTEPDADFTYIDVGCIDQSAGRIVEPQTLRASEAPSRARKVVRKGTVIYSTVRPYLLNIAVIDQEFEPGPIASTAFAVVHPFEGVDRRFLFWAFRSPYFVRYVENCQTGIAYPAINDKQFFCAPFPLPPEAEQVRIVAKVDEMMALCDALEAGTLEAMAAHEKLVRELLATLVNSQDAADLAANWSRIETHFDEMFTTEESIEALKQVTLDLAVRGKLEPQSTSDTPAWESTSRTEMRANSSAFGADAPEKWRWAQLEDCFDVSSGIQKTPARTPRKNPYPYLGVGNVYRGRLDLTAIKQFELAEGELERFRLEPGDILVVEGNGSANEIGRCAVWNGEVENCVHQNHIIRCRPKDVRLAAFAALYLNSPAGMAEMKRLAITSAGLFSLSVGKIRKIPFPLPPFEEQIRIVDKVNEMTWLCNSLKSNIVEAAYARRNVANALVDLA